MGRKVPNNPYEDGDDAKFVPARKGHRKVVTQSLTGKSKGTPKKGKSSIKKVVVK